MLKGDVAINDSGEEWNADEEVLAALGYKPEFKREFTLWTTFCVSFAVLGLLPSFATTLYYGMGYAGTAGMTWGWLVAMIGIQSVAASMAELCSSMPTSGGLYVRTMARTLGIVWANRCLATTQPLCLRRPAGDPSQPGLPVGATGWDK